MNNFLTKKSPNALASLPFGQGLDRRIGELDAMNGIPPVNHAIDGALYEMQRKQEMQQRQRFLEQQGIKALREMEKKRQHRLWLQKIGIGM